MLIVLRNDLSGLLGPRLPLEADLAALILVVEFDSGDLLSVGLGLDGVRSFEDAWAGDEALEVSDGTGRLFLDLGAGKGGTDTAGGSVDGRDGCGKAEAMVVCSTIFDLLYQLIDAVPRRRKEQEKGIFRNLWINAVVHARR